MQPTDDQRCMERLRDGDDLALNELMLRWKEPLVTFGLRYTGNPTDARDIAQETFVKVYGARSRYRPTAPFPTWLFSIAANLCRMRARWRSRHPEILEAEVSDRRVDGADPAVESDRHALAGDLDRAIRTLPHDLRVAFVLAELQGQPHKAIAQVLGCSSKAIERRLARAREELRTRLAKKWGRE